MSQNVETELNLLKKSQQKNELEIEQYKQSLISEIKEFKKEDILKTKKTTLWQKIKMILGL
jgi:hypothetical protein